MILNGDNWKTIGRPGYLGKHRDQRYFEFDQEYGQNNWRIAWQIGSLIVSLDTVMLPYEDAHYFYMARHEDLVEQLINEASDVYDDQPSNVGSGLSYSIQETCLNHLHDIAIRRSLVRLGKWFKGDKLIQLRDTKGEHALSRILSPGVIPFHIPSLIIQPELDGVKRWWDFGSVESFYQSNKILQIRT